MSERKTIRHIAAAAVCACVTVICCETHAQSTGTPNSADTPDKNEKSWTPERMKRAKPLMPNPKTDPRESSQNHAPSPDGGPAVAPGSLPSDPNERGAKQR